MRAFKGSLRWRLMITVLGAGLAALLAFLGLNLRSQIEMNLYDLAYVDIYGDVLLTSTDGRRQRKLIDRSRCPATSRLVWSPAADRLACLGRANRDSLSDSHSILAVADIAGRMITDMKSVTDFAWSPSGRSMAYGLGIDLGEPTRFYVADAEGRIHEQFDGLSWGVAWSPDESALAYTDLSGDLVIFDMRTKNRQRLGPGTILAWVRNDLVLIGIDRRVADIGEYDIYEAYLLDLRDRKRTRFELLDDSTQFWVSPAHDDPFIVVYVREGGDQLSIVHLTPLRMNRVKGSMINSAGSHHVVGGGILAYSRDGSQVLWADLGRESPTAIYRMLASGTAVTKIGTVPPGAVRFSDSLTQVAYVTLDDKPTLWTALIDGRQARRIGRFYPESHFGDFSWRPRK